MCEQLQTHQGLTSKHAHLPYFLFGFSCGSFLTQYFIGEYGKELDVVAIGGNSKNSRLSTKFGQFVAKIGCIFKGKQKPAKKLTFNVYDNKILLTISNIFIDKQFCILYNIIAFDVTH